MTCTTPNVVFVVDDDPGMLMSVKRLLRANGYDSLLFPQRRHLKNKSISKMLVALF
jgi:FixJ family two-component response regulator